MVSVQVFLYFGDVFLKNNSIFHSRLDETDYSRLADIQLVGCLPSSVHACGIIVKYSTQNVEEV